MMKRIFTVLLWFTVIAAQAQGHPRAAGRWVVDDAGVLSDATESMLSQLLNEHEDSTSNQVVVLTITSLGGASIEDYAHDVFNDWGIGQADRDNGVLLLVAVEDRKVRIETGYGLEPYLTDLTSKSIIDNEIVPEFKKGDFDQGVINGVKAILGSINGTYTARPSDNRSSTDIGAILACCAFLSIFSFLSAKTKGGGGYFFFIMIAGFAAIFFLVQFAVIWTIAAIAWLVFLFVIVRMFTARNKSWMKSGGSGGYGGTWSSGGGSWGGGGGGFSGGGGSSGGGGASGSW